MLTMGKVPIGAKRRIANRQRPILGSPIAKRTEIMKRRAGGLSSFGNKGGKSSGWSPSRPRLGKVLRKFGR